MRASSLSRIYYIFYVVHYFSVGHLSSPAICNVKRETHSLKLRCTIEINSKLAVNVHITKIDRAVTRLYAEGESRQLDKYYCSV
jgi:hypothetical protein